MSAFESSPQVYDLIYGSKEYDREARYVGSLLARHGVAAGDILELGCGSGAHACLLAKQGFNVTGVDRSRGMLDRFAARLEGSPGDVRDRVRFLEGDARTVSMGRVYDGVVSLFHVMSYMTADDDLLSAFRAASTHLKPGGVFVFDCWYGPAVLALKPEPRKAVVEDESIRVVRRATPRHLPDRNVVEVHYDFQVKDLTTGREETFTELHVMRYLFQPEIGTLLDRCGLELVGAEEWLTGGELSQDTWNACFVACKPENTP